MLVISQAGNLVNFYIGVFLAPDALREEQLGAVLPLLQLAGFVGVPLSVVIGTALKYVNVFQANGEYGRVKKLLRDMCWVAVVLSVLVAVYVGHSRGFIQARLKIGDSGIIWMVAGIAVISCWLPLVQMAAQGLLKFYPLIVSSVVAPVARLAAIVILIRQFQVLGYLAASFLSIVSVVLFLGWSVRHSFGKKIPAERYGAYLPEMSRHLLLMGLCVLGANLQTMVEPWVIRHRLSLHDSAGYYMVAMFGNIPAYVAPVMAPFLFPLVSARHATGGSTRRMHLQSLAVVLLIAATLITILALSGRLILEIRPSWRAYAAFAPYMWQAAVVASLSAFVGIHITHENARGRFAYLRYYVPVILLEVVALYGLMGWEFFRPFLPAVIFGAVDGLVVRNLQFVLGFMIGARVLLFLGVCAEVLWRNSAAHPGIGRCRIKLRQQTEGDSD
ncbi:MAG: hypothetical protein QME60_07535 [Verrucomicrobiota bacterium]|nr:hypothetical protein [Verrucomicrobiota bacterium]